MNLIIELQSAGMLTESININPVNYCNSIGTKLYVNPFLDTAKNFLSKDHWELPFYTLTFPPELNPASARSQTIKVYAYNLIGQETEMKLGEDFTIIPWDRTSGFIINGTTITEEILTCYKDVGGQSVPYPCYKGIGGSMYLRLNDSQETITLTVTRR
jgi:hypothetical protein